jgi:hypothetical protein
MPTLTGERVLVRVHVGEADKHGGRPLYRALVALLREHGCAGATVLRCIAGFGARREVHSTRNELAATDMPVVVECVETQERLDAVLPEIDAMLAAAGRGALVTLERAKVILYRAEPGA